MPLSYGLDGQDIHIELRTSIFFKWLKIETTTVKNDRFICRFHKN